MRDIKPLEWLLHGLIVLISLVFLNYPEFDLTFGVFSSGDKSLLWPSIAGTIINLMLFYTITLRLIPVILKRRGFLHFVLWTALAFLMLSSIELGMDMFFFRFNGKELTGDMLIEMIAIIVIVHALVVVLALSYRFSKDWFSNEKIRQEISEQQLRSELEVLKSQINPHFLFNALNNLFSMSLHFGDEKTAEGISRLSEMMRYVFDKSGEDQVGLKEEVDYIRDYIHLQQLRFQQHVEVSFDYSKATGPFLLSPMLLIPFVENAFKYGVSSQAKTTISLLMALDEKEFTFSVTNKVVEKKESIPTNGVGIANVRKRLELLYPNGHSLTTSEQDGMFEVQLSIAK